MQADHDDKRGGARAVVRAREDTSAPETAPETPAKRAEMAGADETRQMIARNSLRLAEMESEMQSLRHRISEREKELACHMLLSNLLDEITQSSQHTASVLNEVVSILPPAMQYPDICAARIVLHSATYSSPNWKDSPWKISAEIRCTYPAPRVVGTVEIAYVSDPRVKYAPPAETETEGGAGTLAPDEEPAHAFLNEEISLLGVVAERVGNLLSRNVVEEKISRLTNTLSLCTECDSVRDADGWKSLQRFLEEHSNIAFVRMICPACAEAIIARNVTHPQHPSPSGTAGVSEPQSTGATAAAATAAATAGKKP